MTIERLVELNDWKRTRHAPPERRVLMGETLLVRYVEADQEPGCAEQNRENERRRKKCGRNMRRRRLDKNPEKQFEADQGAVRRVQVVGGEAAGQASGWRRSASIATLEQKPWPCRTCGTANGWCAAYRWSRGRQLPPVPEHWSSRPRPSKCSTATRACTGRHRRHRQGRYGSPSRLATPKSSCTNRLAGEWSRGFVFPAINRTARWRTASSTPLDHCPNDWYGYWCSQVVEGLCCAQQPSTPTCWLVFILHRQVSGSGRPGQLKFLASGLDAFHQAGHLHDFEIGKRSFIGSHDSTPVLLVQGHPAPEKAGQQRSPSSPGCKGRCRPAASSGCSCLARPTPPRTFCSRTCWKWGEVAATRTPTRSCSASTFRRAASLTCPCSAHSGVDHDGAPAGVVHLLKDDEKEKGEENNADVILEPDWAVDQDYSSAAGLAVMLKKKWPKA